MRAAGIIAAGLGERLRGASGGVVKPMLPVGGRPLVHWVVEGLRSAGVGRAVLLTNSSGDPVRDYLRGAFPDVEWTFLRRDTPTSFESFRLVGGELAAGEEPFLMSTVDALVPPYEVRRFAAEALLPIAGRAPGSAMALTRFVDDEKPLWADAGSDGRLAALGDDAARRETATCGLYALGTETAASLAAAPAYARLRDFWREQVRGGLVRGVLLSETVDVDRPEDLPAAERLVASFGARK